MRIEHKKKVRKSNTKYISKSDKCLRETSSIISEYCSHNNLLAADYPSVMKGVYAALTELTIGCSSKKRLELIDLSGRQIQKSICQNYLVSFENGKRYDSLLNHLQECGLTPDSYRLKWGLPSNYPMVAQTSIDGYSVLAKNDLPVTSPSQRRFILT